nr:MAG TPA: hypothetical protein [Caudoviricetes sp.]
MIKYYRNITKILSFFNIFNKILIFCDFYNMYIKGVILWLF